jgi:hypothetical protein
VRQGFVENFQNLNLELARVRNHGHIEPKDLNHERPRIPNRLKEQIWINNKVKMKVQVVADVVPIFIAFVQSLLHQDNIGITYARTSNFKMELITSMPLYFEVMPQYIIIVNEASFVSAPVNIIVGIISKPQTPRGAKICEFA